MYEDLFINDTRLFSFEVSRRLRGQRRRVGLNLSFVAKTLGISEEKLQDYEDGKKQVPSHELSQLSNLYQVSPVYFLGGFSPSEKSERV